MINVCLMHPFDPRGEKVGGLETYIRDFIRFHPEDINILLIGVDGYGDLTLGEPVHLETQNRQILFLPVARYADHAVHQAAKRLSDSITVVFALGLLRFARSIRRLLRRGGYSVDLRRVEFSHFCALNGIPFLQMLHGEGAPKLQMDSLLRKYSFLHNVNEHFAVKHCVRFLCVNPFITERIKATYPDNADKIATLTTWYNPSVYAPTPFVLDDNVFRISFCGRLDLFKAPSLMFRVVKSLIDKCSACRVEFHYIGTSDPSRFPEYEAIRHVTIRHGYKDPAGIATILRTVHCGILTSEFEGMPRFTLESLGAGRPTAAIHLPQLEAVIEDGVSGYLVGRQADELMVADLSDALIVLWSKICAGQIDPYRVAAKVQDFTPSILLGRVYQYHRDIPRHQ